MKIGSWTNKLSAALLAGGLMMPMAIYAANLGENLVVDGSFEDVVDDGQPFARKTLLSWGDGIHIGGTYDRTLATYDIGGPLTGGGDQYFRSSTITVFGQVTEPTQWGTYSGDVSQRIELSTGATGAAIANGTASFNVSAYFTEDIFIPRRALGIVEFDFRDSEDTSLGIHKIGPNELIQPHFFNWTGNEEWLQVSDDGLIPAGTDSVFVSVYSVPWSFGSGDYDRDTLVDGNDFLILQRGEVPQTPTENPEPPIGDVAEWEANYGTFQAGGIRSDDQYFLAPYGEVNGWIDLVDFQITSTAISASAVVPEPASRTLLVSMAMGVTYYWRGGRFSNTV